MAPDKFNKPQKIPLRFRPNKRTETSFVVTNGSVTNPPLAAIASGITMPTTMAKVISRAAVDVRVEKALNSKSLTRTSNAGMKANTRLNGSLAIVTLAIRTRPVASIDAGLFAPRHIPGAQD